MVEEGVTDSTIILKRIEDAGIPTCILHGWQEGPISPASDVDIAVRPGDLAALSRLLAEQEDFACVQLLQHESSCYYFVLARRHGPAIRFLRLDVAADFRRNRRVFLTADDLLRARRRQGPVWVSSPTVELHYLLIKKILKGLLPPHQGDRLRSLLSELGPAGEKIVNDLFGDELGGRTLRLIRGAQWEDLAAAFPRLRHRLLGLSLLRRPLGPAGYLLSDARRFAMRLLWPTGLCIAVMGPDGAGKSTLVGRLRSEVAEAFRTSRLFHLRPGVLASRAGGGDPSRPHGRPPYSSPVSLLKMAYLVLDYLLGFLLRVRPALVRSSVVLFDRYLDDLRVDPRRYRFSGPRWALRVALRLAPRPDLFLFLDVPEDLLLARKTELPAAELRRQRFAYRRLAANLPNAVMLDGALPADEVAQNAVESLVLFMKERYVSRRRSWFHEDAREPLGWLLKILGEPHPSTTAAVRRPGSRAFSLLSLSDGRGFLLPIDRRLAASGALRMYSAQNRKARAAKALLGAVLKVGIVPPILPRIELAGSSRMTGLFGRIEELIGERGLHFAFSLGTPGPVRKPVIQALDSRGRARGFVKVGWDTESVELVRNEARALETLGEEGFRSFDRPELLHAGGWDGLFLLVMGPPPRPVRNAPRELSPQVLDILAEMRSAQLTLRPLDGSPFWKRIEERAGRAMTARDRGVLSRGMGFLTISLAGRQVPFHLSHGDFAPWNMLRGNERIFLFDWEYSDSETPAGYDLFHFLIQTGVLLKRQGPVEVYESLFGPAAVRNGNGPALACLPGGPELTAPLLLLYLMDRIAFHARHPDGHSRTLCRLSALASLCMDGEGRSS